MPGRATLLMLSKVRVSEPLAVEAFTDDRQRPAAHDIASAAKERLRSNGPCGDAMTVSRCIGGTVTANVRSGPGP